MEIYKLFKHLRIRYYAVCKINAFVQLKQCLLTYEQPLLLSNVLEN